MMLLTASHFVASYQHYTYGFFVVINEPSLSSLSIYFQIRTGKIRNAKICQELILFFTNRSPAAKGVCL